jgi:hypothetical protein
MEDALGKAEAVEERRKKNGARIAAGAKGAIEVNFNLASISAAIQSTGMFISGRRCFAAAAYRRRCRLTTFRRRTTSEAAPQKRTERQREKRGREVLCRQHIGCGWCTLEFFLYTVFLAAEEKIGLSFMLAGAQGAFPLPSSHPHPSSPQTSTLLCFSKQAAACRLPRLPPPPPPRLPPPAACRLPPIFFRTNPSNSFQRS